ncbi:nucleoside triphosphatase YtkD [Bacillus sp. V3B]|uniref:RNA deprotection pyrophosphohydrolase n=1 Tax=Bacillus sp. V3B TaxID=2804915 RepID=UPI00210C0E64|nr:nucleoside triphosphatase YtkD [Bacillus sp. V3B]MCQ6274460.1 nucleoside triphosphatase YtkD [Bacillus sp. V3B]
MDTFYDENGGSVKLTFLSDSFSKQANHVFVICRYKDQWLLTKHKIRGWEFPGGKREQGETLEETAIREVEEETGAQIKSLQFIGEYEVTNKENSFVKAIYYAEVETLTGKEDYLETNGPVLIGGDLLMQRFQGTYSFIMKDKVVEKALKKIMRVKRNSND